MDIDERYKYFVLGVILIMLVWLLIEFVAVVNGQPREFSCDRAIDAGCCDNSTYTPDDGDPDPDDDTPHYEACNGQLVPEEFWNPDDPDYVGDDGQSAVDFCRQFDPICYSDDARAQFHKLCLPVLTKPYGYECECTYPN